MKFRLYGIVKHRGKTLAIGNSEGVFETQDAIKITLLKQMGIREIKEEQPTAPEQAPSEPPVQGPAEQAAPEPPKKGKVGKMKRFFQSMLMLLAFVACASAHDYDSTVTRTSYFDTLTSTIDTVEIRFAKADYFDALTITAYMASSTATVTVQTYNENLGVWVTVGLTDVVDNTYDAAISATTTPKEYILGAAEHSQIRLLASSISTDCYVSLVLRNLTR